jgi:hypothetical protein
MEEPKETFSIEKNNEHLDKIRNLLEQMIDIVDKENNDVVVIKIEDPSQYAKKAAEKEGYVSRYRNNTL